MGGRGNRGPRNISLGTLRNLATHGLHSVNCRQCFGENYHHGGWQRLLPFSNWGGGSPRRRARLSSTTAEVANAMSTFKPVPAEQHRLRQPFGTRLQFCRKY